MSKILKKALKRVSWRPSEGSQYPVTTPEVPTSDQGAVGNGRIGNGNSTSHLHGVFEVERPEEEEEQEDRITLAIIGAGQRGR
ncbi:13285_t:CDS:1, partial [Acaulospora colombiana]